MPPRPFSEFVTLVCEALAPLGGVRARRMFGGYGISCDGLTFALVSDDTLYFKVDDANRPAYEALGLASFRPMPDRPVELSYRQPPAEVFDDNQEMLTWARPALDAALRAAAKKAAKGKRKPVGAS